MEIADIGRTRARRVACVATVLLASGAFAGLRDDVELEIRRASLGLAVIGVSVRDASSGAALVAVNDEEALIPASNMKLLTSGAALDALRGEFSFRTRLLLDGRRLVVRGDGDPGFGDPVLLEETAFGGRRGVDVEDLLEVWVRAVVETGLGGVDELVVDDRIFDRERVHRDWPLDQLNRRYCAEVAGLNFHLNVLNFYPRPASGERPDVSLMQPRAGWIEVVNRATARTGQQEANSAWIARRPGSNELTLYGNVRFPYKAPVPVTFNDPPEFFAQLLADRLEEAGVRVASYRAARDDDPRHGGEPLGPVVATPIATALVRCNRDSHNLYAEALLKRAAAAITGEPGSWSAGAAIVRRVVHERVGDPRLAAGLAVADGSGLSRENRVTAATLTAWLASFHADAKAGPLFVASLAKPGEGTLEERFAGVNLEGASLRAKSGYVRGVSCLSGYVTAPDGRRRAFSILVNGLEEPGSVAQAKTMQERVVAAIARDLAGAAPPARVSLP